MCRFSPAWSDTGKNSHGSLKGGGRESVVQVAQCIVGMIYFHVRDTKRVWTRSFVKIKSLRIGQAVTPKRECLVPHCFIIWGKNKLFYYKFKLIGHIKEMSYFKYFLRANTRKINIWCHSKDFKTRTSYLCVCALDMNSYFPTCHFFKAHLYLFWAMGLHKL